MAQEASPKVAGQPLLRRAHLTRSSIRPVKKLCWRSSRPIAQAASSPGVGRDALMRVMVDSEVRLGMPDCSGLGGAHVRAALGRGERNDTNTTAAKTMTSIRPNVAIWWKTIAHG